jgi:hypothetical protein
MVGKAQKSHGARSELNSVFVMEKHLPYSLDLTPKVFLGFSSHGKGALSQISK